jgi:hypothetical protein
MNSLTAFTRGSYLAGVIEVELPRWTITPLDREETKYWTMNQDGSDLPGGTWTMFNWNQIITGRKLYRLQYSADLREPQAEVDLEELLSFLLDRGAVPDAKGIHMLRLAGLFTPVGTGLLLSPDSKETVLRIALSDDSDGVLSLALHWKPTFDIRDEGSLPPSWMCVKALLCEDEAITTEESTADEEQPTDNRKEAESVKERRSIRFHLGPKNGILCINTPVYEPYSATTADQLSAAHLSSPWAGSWFPAAAAALGRTRNLALWTCHIPDATAALARKDILPCGVLVLAGLLDPSAAPAWDTKYDPHEDAHAAHQRFASSSRRANAENRLPPAQAQAARMLRQAEERDAFFEETRGRLQREKARKEQRWQEALSAPRLDTLVVARAALEQLQLRREAGLEGCGDVQQAAERVLHAGIRDAGVAERTCGFLDRLQQAAERGGMNLEDLFACEKDAVALASSSRVSARRARWPWICRSALVCGRG